MNVQGASLFPTALAGLASDMRTTQVQGAIAGAVLRQIQDTERQQAEAIIRMMQQSNAVAQSTGASAPGRVDVYA